jgi:flagellum-specific peptidoglycan hydrolase FlgJ
LSKKDYKGWAHGLKKAGYATDKRYAYKLISLIETLNLHQYDKK